MNGRVEVIATLGPSLMTEKEIALLIGDPYHVRIFRMNGGHISPEALDSTLEHLSKEFGDEIQILLDLPGRKIRTTNLNPGLPVKAGRTINLFHDQVNFPGIFEHLQPKQLVLVADGAIHLEIESINSDKVVLMALTDGLLQSNKGLHFPGSHVEAHLPFLFEKDRALIETGKRRNVSYFGLSFVHSPDDIHEFRTLVSKDQKFFAKIETNEAVQNLTAILELDSVERVIIDRGDLSTAVSLYRIPEFQKQIINECKSKNVKVGVATHFLHSTVTKDTPHISDVADLYHTLESGVDYLQFSDETAVSIDIEKPIQILRDIEACIPK